MVLVRLFFILFAFNAWGSDSTEGLGSPPRKRRLEEIAEVHPDSLRSLLSDLGSDPSVFASLKQEETLKTVYALHRHIMNDESEEFSELFNSLDNPKPYEYELLYNSIASNNLTLGTFLLDRVSSIDCEEAGKMTPLMVSAQHKNIEFSKLLVERGANYNLKDENGQTPIIHSLIYNEKHKDYGRLARYFARLPGIDVAAKSTEGETVLHLALPYNTPELFTVLLEAYIRQGLSIYEPGYAGRTVLHAAIESDKHLIIPEILKYHTDFSRTDAMGLTPLDYCEEKTTESALLVRKASDSLRSYLSPLPALIPSNSGNQRPSSKKDCCSIS